VIVLEKSAVPGGSTAISGGWAWIPNNSVEKAAGIDDSREKAMEYMHLVAGGQGSEELITAFVDKGPEMVDFVADNSPLKWDVATGLWPAEPPCTEYHPEWPGGNTIGRSLWPLTEDGTPGGGSTLIQHLLDGCTAADVEVLYETPVTKLISRLTEGDIHEVLGVYAQSGDETIAVKAKKGVLLSAGGFDWDWEMKANYLRGPTIYATGVRTLEGDGIKMAQAIGADLRNMNEAWGMPVYKEEAVQKNSADMPCGLSVLLEKTRPGAIMVNKYGERFCNEASDYDSMWRSFFEWENWGANGYRNIPAWLIMDANARVAGTLCGKMPDQELPDYVFQADTLAELAEKIGVDAAGLETTIKEWNEAVANGSDPWFHRGESAYDRAWGLGTDDATATIGPLTDGPYYAAEVAMADIGTCGGVRVNGDAQALNPFGEVLPRLYASGNNAGVGGPGCFYGGGGGTIGPAMTFSYLAGKHVVTLEPWTKLLILGHWADREPVIRRARGLGESGLKTIIRLVAKAKSVFPGLLNGVLADEALQGCLATETS
jgi:succinate dehydrogenase/fumarate reductase flavoprotein subunit